VIYVMGAGRSGSTILGVTLGNCENLFYAGELDKWLLMSGVSMHERAGIVRGREEDDRGLWRLVREDVAGAEELFGRQTRRYIEHSSALFRPGRRRALRRLRRNYRRVTEDLYGTIVRRTRAACIVDSSHLPLRARELQSLDGIDLYLLFLVRDPRSVVASWDRPGLPEPRFSVLATNAYLWLTHLLAVLVFLRHPRERRLFVRYEDFTASPEAILRDILDRVGSPAGVPDLTRLDTGTPYHGNRLILSEVVSLQRESGARRRPSRVTTLLQLPWTVILPRLQPSAGAS
jgi:Sulfotransferase family